ncbi:membrane protein [Mycobacterium phage ILeeKay]|nr:membrane protein [Mycobacterium phage ILeeKay]
MVHTRYMTAALIIISFIPVMLAVIAGYAFVSQP